MRPTARGVGAACAGAALIAAGFLFGYPELAVVGASALLALVCAALYAAFRPALSVARTVDPERVSVGFDLLPVALVAGGFSALAAGIAVSGFLLTWLRPVRSSARALAG